MEKNTHGETETHHTIHVPYYHKQYFLLNRVDTKNIRKSWVGQINTERYFFVNTKGLTKLK